MASGFEIVYSVRMPIFSVILDISVLKNTLPKTHKNVKDKITYKVIPGYCFPVLIICFHLVATALQCNLTQKCNKIQFAINKYSMELHFNKAGLSQYIRSQVI